MTKPFPQVPNGDTADAVPVEGTPATDAPPAG